jgi:4-amino-4-deoxy-L-arabinose transferase-like glycosyltransferase
MRRSIQKSQHQGDIGDQGKDGHRGKDREPGRDRLIEGLLHLVAIIPSLWFGIEHGFSFPRAELNQAGSMARDREVQTRLMVRGARTNQSGVLILSIFVFWFVLLIGSYHLNFPTGTIFSNLHALVLAGLIFLSAAGIGLHILRHAPFLPAIDSSLLGFFLALGLGLGSMELLTLGALAMGWVHPAWAWSLLAIGIVAAGRATRVWRQQWREGWLEFAGGLARFESRRWLKPLLILTGAGWGMALLAALAPAEFYDALIYHLAVPAEYLRAGGIEGIPGNYYAHFPANQGMLYALAQMLREDQIASGSLSQVLHLLCGASAILTIFIAGRRHFRPGVAHLALLLGAAVPGVLLTAIYPVADMAVMLHGALVLACLLEAAKNDGSASRQWIVLAGIFAGLALGTKYVAVVSVLAPALLWLLWEARRMERRHLVHAGLFVMAASILFAPWAARNVAITGNPMAPYFAELFGSEAAGPGLSAELSRRGPEESSLSARVAHAASGPWKASMERLGAGGYLGVGYLLLIPFALLKREEGRALGLVAVVGIAALVFWSFTIQVTRYLFPALPALALLAASGAVAIIQVGPWTRRALAAGVSWIVLHNLYLFAVLGLTINPFAVVFGVESTEDYLGRRVGYYPAARFMQTQLPEDARVILVGEGRTYYVKHDHSANSPFDEDRLSVLARQASAEGSDLSVHLRSKGYTHLLVNGRELARITRERGRSHYFAASVPDERAAIDALLMRTGEGAGARVLFEKSGVAVLEIAAD